MDKFLSIITNFGCHGKCPYCIVRENGIDVPKTTIEGLDNLLSVYKENDCNIISLSGGGDPLHNYEKHRDYYNKLLDVIDTNKIRLEMHTSYEKSHSYFPMEKTHRVVYHLRDLAQLNNVKRKGEEIVRVVYVVTKEMTEEDILTISSFVKLSSNIDELSFRQMVDNNYNTTYYHYDFLKEGHGKQWYYIEQGDYNLYYVNGVVFDNFSEIHA